MNRRTILTLSTFPFLTKIWISLLCCANGWEGREERKGESEDPRQITREAKEESILRQAGRQVIANKRYRTAMRTIKRNLGGKTNLIRRL